MTPSDDDGSYGPLDFRQPDSYRREDFILTKANSRAFDRITGGAWPDGRLVLVGPAASGKTHVATIWTGMSEGLLIPAARLPDLRIGDIPPGTSVAVDDSDLIASHPDLEAPLLHLINYVGEQGGAILMTACQAPTRWGCRLADLGSRLEGAGLVRLHQPDDHTLAAILVKLFADRQIAVPSDVVEYIVPRIERSYSDAVGVVERINHRSLGTGKRITRRLAADVMKEVLLEESSRD